jgi:hypothetical protein
MPEALERAAAAAKAEAESAAVIEEQPTITLPLPDLGRASGGDLRIDALRDASGAGWVRIVWHTPGNLTVMDLPVRNAKGDRIAHDVGRALVAAARRADSGLVLPGDG